MTLIEAMGTGLPIIASDVGGIPDMLMDQKDALSSRFILMKKRESV